MLGASNDSQQLQGFAMLLLLGVGPLVMLFGAAFFSRWKWYQYVTLGLTLLCAVFYSLIGLIGGKPMVPVGLAAWTIAFIGVAIAGFMRLVTL